MKRKISFVLALVLALSLMSVGAYAAPAEENPFTDVKAGEYYTDAVLWAIRHDPQITTGTTKTTFEPNASCTRGQMVTFLWRAAGCPQPTITENPFADVQKGLFYYDAVLWAFEHDVTTGTTKTTFEPDATVNRAQAVTFLWRTAGAPHTTAENPFHDVGVEQYYSDAVLWAAANGITTGTTPVTFEPDSACLRGQIVTFLHRSAMMEPDELVYLPVKETLTYEDGGVYVTEWTYDENGNNIKAVGLWPESDSTFQTTQTRTFNALGDPMQEIYVGGKTTVTHSYSYDEQGNLTKLTKQFQDSAGSSSSSQTYTYNAQGQLESIYDDAYPRTERFTYDENGNVASQIFSYDEGGEDRYDYTYDENGNVLTVTNRYGDLEEVTTYTYDADGNVLSELRKTQRESIYTTYTYTFDENGNVLKQQSFLNGTELLMTISYEYQSIPVGKLADHWQLPMEAVVYV